MTDDSALLLRYWYETGGLQAAYPLRVVEEADERIVAWLTGGTECRYWATSDGADPRSLPLNERFDRPLTHRAHRWEGRGTLRVMLPGHPYQVLHFWDADDMFAGWYVNFERPMQRNHSRVDTVDWHLDLWIDPNGACHWKDVDEAEAAVAAGSISQASVDIAREAGARIIDDVAAFLARVGDWRHVRPHPDWRPLPLPSDYAD